MKKCIIIGTLVIGLVASASALYKTGWGKEVSSTTVTARLTGFTANTLSLINNGTNTVYALVNCSTNTFNTRLAAETCTPVKPGTVWTWNCETQTSIDSVVHATTNGASAIVLGSF